MIVYLGNFAGSIGTVALMFFTRQYTFGGNAVGIAALRTGVAKVNFDFIQAVALGILCNALVCLAIWLTYSARSTVDKILAILFPITAFVAAGFEHSVANMYFIPYALSIKYFDPEFVATVGDEASNLDLLTWQAFFMKNLSRSRSGTSSVARCWWQLYTWQYSCVQSNQNRHSV